MAISLLSEPGMALATPPVGNREKLAREIDARFTPAQAQKFFASEWIIPARMIAIDQVTVSASEVECSIPGAADVQIGCPSMDLHLLSFRKSLAKVKEGISPRGVPILALDLRAYAKMWWDTCDAKKEDRLKQAGQARQLMKWWLSEQQTGRGWLFHPELETKKAELIIWANKQTAKRREEELKRLKDEAERSAELERERQEAIARMREQEARSPWRIPELNPQTAAVIQASPYLATSAGALTKAPDVIVTLNPEVQQIITKFLAADLGLFWHETKKVWAFVGTAPGVVPPAIRRYLRLPLLWEIITPDQREKLRGMRSADFPVPLDFAGKKTSKLSRHPNHPPASDSPDTVIRESVGKCMRCGAPTTEVVFGSGMFCGKKGVICSNEPRHPMTVY